LADEEPIAIIMLQLMPALSRWPLILGLVAIVAASPASAAPLAYSDTKDRFELVLGEGWRLAPRFGDLYGMTFEKSVDGREIAILTVHVDEVVARDLGSFAQLAAEAWADKDERLRERHEQKIAGERATIRTSEIRDRHIRSAFLATGGRYFHLRLDTPRSAARTMEPEWSKLLTGFRPKAKASEERPRPPPPPRGPSILGRYERGGVELALLPGGRFRLGDQSGAYEVEEDTLVLAIEGRSPIRFEFELGEGGRTLSLSSPGLERPTVYTRVGAAAGAEPPVTKGLVGRWEAEVSGRKTVLVLAKSGQFEMGPLSGRWEETPGRLTLFGGHGESTTYRVELGPGRLVLAGGDLDAPLTFRRAGGE